MPAHHNLDTTLTRKVMQFTRIPRTTAVLAVTASKLESFWSQKWKADVIWCRRAQNPGEAHQRRAAEKLGGSWHELDTGHYPMLSMPAELTQLLVQAR